eukprot:scaffold122242_cov22-Tisochrysis_lutea.AAC.2
MPNPSPGRIDLRIRQCTFAGGGRHIVGGARGTSRKGPYLLLPNISESPCTIPSKMQFSALCHAQSTLPLNEVLPHAEYYKRGGFPLKKIVQFASNRDFTDLVVFNEDSKEVKRQMQEGEWETGCLEGEGPRSCKGSLCVHAMTRGDKHHANTWCV